MQIPRDLNEKIVAYYVRYYRDVCSLPDWQERSIRRAEEESAEFIKAGELEKLLGMTFRGQKHCIVGAGTGGLAIALREQFGVDVYGVEPDADALSIIHDKCILAGIARDSFKLEYGENMSFADKQFDVVHCYTVLEHVQSVEKCLKEMARITKPGGIVYIHTPNYSYPYEGHYKIFFPTFLPRFLGVWYLRLLGKSPNFLKTLQFVTERSVNRILMNMSGIVWERIYRPLKPSTGKLAPILNYLVFNRFIYPNQEIVIRVLQKQG